MPSRITKHRDEVMDSMFSENTLRQWNESKIQRKRFENYWDKAFNEYFYPMLESKQPFKNNCLCLGSALPKEQNVIVPATVDFEKKINIGRFQPSDIDVTITA